MVVEEAAPGVVGIADAGAGEAAGVEVVAEPGCTALAAGAFRAGDGCFAIFRTTRVRQV